MTTTVHQMDLPGLREDMARDFLAALGLLRLLDLRWPKHVPKLFWDKHRGFPAIQTHTDLPAGWCQRLVADIQSLETDPQSPLFHGDIIKTDHITFRSAIIKAIQFNKENHPLSPLPELMFSAYGGQVSFEKTGHIEPTMLSFANGQSGKSLLRDARELIRAWDSEETIAALAGRGTPRAAKSFRWAPQEYRPAAHRAHDPGSNIKGDDTLDTPEFNILAFFGLSCVPTISTNTGHITSAVIPHAKGWVFQWPVWETPIDIDEVVGLLSAKQSQLEATPGVFQIWQSRRLVAEKSVYFAPASVA